MAESRIASLAATVAASTRQVDEFLNENHLPTPSFAPDAPKAVPIPPDAVQIEAARKAALESCYELIDLLQGVTGCLRPNMNGTSLQAVYKYRIAFKVPKDGSVSFKDLADDTGVPELDLRRILRFAMSWHRVFCEPVPGFVAHTAASRELAENPKAHDMLGLSFEESWQSMARASAASVLERRPHADMAKTVDAIEKFDDQDAHHSGHALANNTNDNMFDYLRKNPEKAKRFTNAISTLMPSGQAAEILVDAFTRMKSDSHVVDVGGGSGGVSVILAKQFPNMHFTVQDLPEVIDGAESGIPEEFRDRIKFVAHNFFDPQPIKGADVYFLRAIFHNWPDQRCVQILRRIVPAMEEGSWLIINDSVAAEPGTLGLLAERNARAYDMLMMTLFNGRDREAGDWGVLLKEADSSFELVSMRKPDAGGFGTIVVRLNTRQSS